MFQALKIYVKYVKTQKERYPNVTNVKTFKEVFTNPSLALWD